MVTRKNRPVLYEVVNRSRRARTRSGGWRFSAAPPAAPAAADRPAAPPAAPARPAAAPPAGTRAVRFADGRLRLDLGWPHLAVAAVLLVAVLVGVFQAGRRSARPATAADLSPDFLFNAPEAADAGAQRVEPMPGDRGITGPIVTPLDPRGGEDDGTAASGTPGPVEEEPRELASGFYYVVVQYFPRSERAAAEAAQQFLQARGVECRVLARRADLVLVATQPFTSEAQAENLKRRIRDIGKEYFPIGRYDFRGCLAVRF